MIELSKEHPYEDACKILHVSPIANWKSYKLSESARNFIKMETIAEVLNEGWKPDLRNLNTVRYVIYAYIYRCDSGDGGYAGLVSCCSGASLGSVLAYVGTALEFKNRETANKFQELCKPLIIKHLLNRDDYENFEIRF